MDIDASQYAEISRELLKSGDYLHIYDRGMEYLDKPPLLFWVSALSMKVFGVNNIGYKFPSILFGLWALFATYKLTRRLYDDATGRLAALILATCQGMFLMTNDVRCDTLLMSLVITSVWQLQEWLYRRKLPYLFGAFAACGLGMMTKGPIALMVPVFCFSCDWVLKREWRNFFKPAYIPGLLLMALVLLPMSIGLYQQFDQHPEKLVNGLHGVSGLRFFYWTQSFGRITGENPWKNAVDISFLFMNMLWSYLPWVFLLVPALVVNIIIVVKQKFKLSKEQEWISTGGFLITYVALGSSSYQLPHYIFVAFPLASIAVAKLLQEMIDGKKYRGLYKTMNIVIISITALVLGLTLLLLTYVFPAGWPLVAACAAGVAVWVFLLFYRNLAGKAALLPAAGMIIGNIFLTNYVYFTLLGYQVGSQAGRYVHAQGIKGNDIAAYKVDDPLNCFNFYAQEMIDRIDSTIYIANRHYLLTTDNGLEDVRRANRLFDILKQGPFFKVSELTPEFLNPAKRSNAVKKYYLIHLK